MSVLIKGMQIPDNYYQCMISGFRTAIKCNEWTKISSGLRQTYRVLSCPLVKLPEHHGRLIDEDEIEIPSLETVNDQYLVFDAIKDAPTIIEEE